MSNNKNNIGYRNTGGCNTGDWNTGNRNTGDWNTGNCNTGYRNTGDWNTGYRNTGDWNTGNCNTGDWNTGYRNTGDCNTGDWNTGYRNTGDWNTGNWNTCDKETGFFNTEQAEVIRVFNKDYSLEDWENADKPDFLYFSLTEWVDESEMTDKEKVEHKTFNTTGGFLKEYEYKEAFRKSWDNTSLEDRRKVLDLPNFDNEVFKEISGIDVHKELNEKPSCNGKVVEIDGKKYTLVEKE